MKKNKKVVHITTVHHPFDTRIYHKECISLQDAGYDVTLIAPEHEDLKIETSIINIIPIKKYKNKILRMLITTLLAYFKAKKLKADYYHIHDPELLPIAWLLKNKSNNVIYDIHEDYVTSIMQKEYIPKSIRKATVTVYKSLEKIFSRKLHLCLAEKYYKDIYSRGTCILNYPRINKKLVKESKDTVQNKNKLIYTGNVLLDRGAINHAKIPLLDNEIKVYIYGLCPREIADKMMQSAGDKKEHLIINGIDHFVSREVIDNAYINKEWLAGLAIFPPTDHYQKKELTKFFEYMNAGIPIICSDFPAWKEFINKYKCGITVNPFKEEEIKEAIQYLRDNPVAANEMGNNGQKFIFEELNWGREEKRLIDWYVEIGQNRKE